MLRVNLSNGSTLRLDLEHPDDLDEWKRLVNQESFQKSIRGAAIQREGVCYALPLPTRFGDAPTYAAELVWDTARDRLAAERISCFVSNVRIDLTVYASGSPPMSRVDLTRVGKRRHVPPAQPVGAPDATTRLRRVGHGASDRTQERTTRAQAKEVS